MFENQSLEWVVAGWIVIIVSAAAFGFFALGVLVGWWL